MVLNTTTQSIWIRIRIGTRDCPGITTRINSEIIPFKKEKNTFFASFVFTDLTNMNRSVVFLFLSPFDPWTVLFIVYASNTTPKIKPKPKPNRNLNHFNRSFSFQILECVFQFHLAVPIYMTYIHSKYLQCFFVFWIFARVVFKLFGFGFTCCLRLEFELFWIVSVFFQFEMNEKINRTRPYWKWEIWTIC